MTEFSRGWFYYAPDAHLRAVGWISSNIMRWTGIFCLLLPLLFYFGYLLNFHPLFNRFALQAERHVSNLHFTFLASNDCELLAMKEPQELFLKPNSAAYASEIREIMVKARDLSGRYLFSIASAFLQFLSLLCIIYALSAIGRRTNFLRLVTITCFIFIAGGLFSYLDAGATRKILAEPILASAIQEKLIPVGTVGFVGQTVGRNLFMGITAMLAALVGLAVVAIRARDEELAACILLQRSSDMRLLMGLAAALLVMTVVATKGLVDWSLALLCDPQRIALKPVGDALGNYWGAAATGVLTAAAIPAYIAWSKDVQRFALRERPSGTEKERQEFLAAEKLDFSLTASVITFISVVTPALTGSLMEILKLIAK